MCRIVVDLLRLHGFDHADLVCHPAMIRKEIGDELALAEFLKLGQVTLHLELLSLQLGDGLSLGE